MGMMMDPYQHRLIIAILKIATMMLVAIYSFRIGAATYRYFYLNL